MTRHRLFISASAWIGAGIMLLFAGCSALPVSAPWAVDPKQEKTAAKKGASTAGEAAAPAGESVMEAVAADKADPAVAGADVASKGNGALRHLEGNIEEMKRDLADVKDALMHMQNKQALPVMESAPPPSVMAEAKKPEPKIEEKKGGKDGKKDAKGKKSGKGKKKAAGKKKPGKGGNAGDAEAKPSAGKAPAGKAAAEPQAAAPAPRDNFDLHDNDVRDVKEILAKMNAKLDQLSAAKGSGKGSKDAGKKKEPTFKQEYERAMAAHKNGKHDEAVMILQDLISKNPPKGYKDNLEYWLGVNYLELSLFDEALHQFQFIVQEYPRGNKVHDARYMQAMVYQKKGEKGLAREYYELALKHKPPKDVKTKIEDGLRELQQ